MGKGGRGKGSCKGCTDSSRREGAEGGSCKGDRGEGTDGSCKGDREKGTEGGSCKGDRGKGTEGGSCKGGSRGRKTGNSRCGAPNHTQHPSHVVSTTLGRRIQRAILVGA